MFLLASENLLASLHAGISGAYPIRGAHTLQILLLVELTGPTDWLSC